MPGVHRGCLAIADITGYSRYLAGVELEHSQDVLADLLNVVVRQMQGLLRLAKLEGDAVFCHDGDDGVDGSTLLAMLTSCYEAFAGRRQTIDRHTTCTCDACRLIPTLDLKFLVHHGEYVLHEIAGSRELMGPDVILVHRLLKSAFTQRTGVRGYAMFTEICLRRFGLDPAALGMIAHREAYEDVGEVAGHVLNLEARWRLEQERRAVYVGEGQGVTVHTVELPAPPARLWHLLTAPDERARWQPGTERVDEEISGARGVGTINHCVHGDASVVEEEILDWRPFRYFTQRNAGPFGVALITTEMAPSQDGAAARVSWRFLPDGGERGMAALQVFIPMLEQWYGVAVEGLRRRLSGAGETADGARE